MFDWIEAQTQKIATSPIAGQMLMFRKFRTPLLVPKLAFHIKPEFYNAGVFFQIRIFNYTPSPEKNRFVSMVM